jgi:hypothetical protein
MLCLVYAVFPHKLGVRSFAFPERTAGHCHGLAGRLFALQSLDGSRAPIVLLHSRQCLVYSSALMLGLLSLAMIPPG